MGWGPGMAKGDHNICLQTMQDNYHACPTHNLKIK